MRGQTERPDSVAPHAAQDAVSLDQFRRDLLAWFAIQHRDLPWRRTRDPYSIWVSETMLQQTRVAAVMPYYARFLTRFPNLEALAAAPEAELLAHWAGLGYYHRARNLQRAAQIMCEAGGFPKEHNLIRSLPGVGDYTAAAVASIAFDLPHAVLDGNVMRVLSRVFNDGANIASVAGRKHFSKLAASLLDYHNPAAHNQAMMELGATVCLSKNPQCLICPVSNHCGAQAHGQPDRLPVKLVVRKSSEELRTIFWIERGGEILVWQRPADSRLMAGFWELPELAHLMGVTPGRLLGSFRHTITFHKYRFEVVEANVPSDIGECRWMSFAELSKVPISTIFRKTKQIIDKVRPRSQAAIVAS